MRHRHKILTTSSSYKSDNKLPYKLGTLKKVLDVYIRLSLVSSDMPLNKERVSFILENVNVS